MKTFYIDVCPYGLFVDANSERDYKLESWLVSRCHEYLDKNLITRKELEKFGGERPEGYIYAYGMLQQFQLPNDDYWVGFPNRDAFSLYPDDLTYNRLDFLEKERQHICWSGIGFDDINKFQ